MDNEFTVHANYLKKCNHYLNLVQRWFILHVPPEGVVSVNELFDNIKEKLVTLIEIIERK